MKFNKSVIIAGVSALLMSGAASAATLDGETVDIQYLFPTQSTVNTTVVGEGQYVVGNGVETNFSGVLAIDVAGNSITLRSTGDYPLSQPAAFQGVRISDWLGTIGDFSNLQIVENDYNDTVEASFDADNLYFNFSSDGDGVVRNGGYVKATFDVAAVPVPAAGFLLLAGIGALGAARKRSKR